MIVVVVIVVVVVAVCKNCDNMYCLLDQIIKTLIRREKDCFVRGCACNYKFSSVWEILFLA